jgi:hypothetical protein
MEAAFKTTFADVRVHVGPQATAIGALAFTRGTDLFFAPGHYDPLTLRGQQLLAHELTHVVQQRAGRVKNPFGSGVAVVHDRALEDEADRMGHLVARPTLPGQGVSAASAGRPGAPVRPPVPAVAQGRMASPPPPLPPRARAAVLQPASKGGGGGKKDYSNENFLVVLSYSTDTAKNVRDAFFRAGYTMGTWAAAAKKAIKASRWRREKVAHGLGKEGASGKRGGTDEEVQELAEYLMGWAQLNPPTPTCKPSSHGYTRRKEDDDEKGGGGGGGGSKGTSSTSTYVAPWNGGPSAWYPRKVYT